MDSVLYLFIKNKSIDSGLASAIGRANLARENEAEGSWGRRSIIYSLLTYRTSEIMNCNRLLWW